MRTATIAAVVLLAATAALTGCRRTTVVRPDGSTVTHVRRPILGDKTVVRKPADKTVVIRHEVDGGAHETIEIEKAPPKVIVETRPTRPSTKHVWVSGYWAWRGGRYVWVKGVYVLPPRGRRAWVPGRYKRVGRRWVWVAGRWD